MAGKKREIQLQAVVNSQSLWDEMLQNKGLTVIDVYQAWCGPCKAMQTLFRKLKNELNEDELLHFVVAEADNIVTLQPFRDKCEPVFLFSVNGKIIAKINGANAPLVNQKIINLVNEEKKIAAGEMVRPQLQFIIILNYILDFYSLEEYLERQHISQFCDVEENITDVNHFIDMFFPDFKNMENLKLEKILALLRPALFQEKKEDVLKIIEDEGFKILMQRQIVLSEEEAQTLCKEYENEDYFGNLIEKMTSGPSLALVLVRDHGLQHWKELIGPGSVEKAKEYLPESLCIRFAMEDLPINQLYGSDSLEAAEMEIQYFFPPQSTLALLKPHVTQEQREEILKLIREAGFEITQMKEMLLNEEEAEKIYSKIKGKDFYQDVLEMLSEGPSLVMVLTKWNAVSDWRQLMGPVEPDEAKLLSPDSIRAKFGRSVLKNAVHGSSNTYEAMESITRIFEEFVPENPEEN
ncbi:thioredoxin domain-containing protein 3 [Mirounga leonina]|uniref:thioredoxin domain-containing protein 3 n=1 Tax=Mirounga leonina TaxID=9715 RepID=UPI00156C1234|nr:thioredoxin domain-containing protein 3 [Mirounga leonina]